MIAASCPDAPAAFASTTKRRRPGPAIAGVCVALAASIPLFAQAAGLTWSSPVLGQTPSGLSGTGVPFTAPTTNAVVGFLMREKEDDPVLLEVSHAPLCPEIGECPGGTSTARLRTTPGIDGNVTSQKWVAAGSRHFVTSLQVCASAQSGKIKGLRIWSASVRPGGALSPAANPHEFTRPNCQNNWSNRVSCSAGRVVVGVVAYHAVRKGFTGIKIQCAAPVAGGTAASGGSGTAIQVRQ